MKNRLYRLLCILFILFSESFVAQSVYELGHENWFDTIYDRHGKKFLLENYKISEDDTTVTKRVSSAVTCTAGYFIVYFANGSGMETPGDASKRAVICELLSNLSGMVNPSLLNTSTKVKILVDDPASMGAGLLAMATGFYNVPLGSTNPGYIQNNVQKTIITQQDAYFNVSSPLNIIGGSSGGFYHGAIYFSKTVTWHTNMSTAPGTNVYDLYSVALHEMTHALGFASLIDYNGNSKFGSSNQYYATYDKFVCNSSGTPVLSPPNSICPNYQLNYVGGSTAVSPNGSVCPNNGSNSTSCNLACRYISPNIPSSVNMKLYTPNCFEPPSSLSHFEDMCYPTPPHGNDVYFVMSNANGTGMFKRYLKEEERLVLCDIGYSCTAQYTSNAILSPTFNTTHNYNTGACSPPNVWGVNDGLNGTAYTWQGTSVINIPISTIKNNDSPGSNPVCITFAYNYQLNLTITSSNIQIAIPTGISYCGPVLLQYIPKDAAGNYGNITYIHAYMKCGPCNPPALCNLVQNGGFENTQNNTICGGSGSSSGISPTSISCWHMAASSPDLFNSNCSNAGNYKIGTTQCLSQWGLGSTFNGAPNYKAVGFGYGGFPLSSEVIRNNLSSPLVPTATYVVSCWLFNSSVQGTRDVVVSLASEPNFASGYNASNIFPNNYNVVTSFTLPSSTVNQWTYHSTIVTFTSPANQQHSSLLIGTDYAKSLLQPNGSSIQAYAIIDDVSIVPISQFVAFSLPNTICSANSLTNLAQYASSFPGSFAGPGVTQNGTQFNFNSPPTLTPGVYPVSFTYTSNAGCTYTTWSTANVGGINTMTNASTCSSGFYTLQAQGFLSGTSFTWIPGNSNSNSIIVNPTSNTIYTLIAQNSSCTVTYTASIMLPVTPTVNPLPPVCLGSTSGILQSYLSTGTPTFGVFSGPGIINGNCGGSICSFIDLSTGSYTAGTYTYTYTLYPDPAQGYNCLRSTTFSVQFIPNFTLSVGALPFGTNCVTSGQSTTLQALSTSTAVTSFTWEPGAVISNTLGITINSPTNYTLSGSNGGCINTMTFTITPHTPVTFSNLPSQLCTYQNIFYLENWLSAQTPTGGTWSAPFQTAPTGTPGLTSGYLNPNLTPLGLQTIDYSYNPVGNPGCAISNTFQVNIVQGFSIATNGISTQCTNIAGYGAVLSATANPGSGFTYTWYPGSLIGQTHSVTPSVQTVYTVNAIAPNGCSFDASQVVDVKNNCCTANNYFTSSSISTGTYSGQWAINQNTTINGNVAFSGEFRIAPNVSITVIPGSTLSSLPFSDSYGLHMYSCSDMWEGIFVQNGGKVFFGYGDLIEDAKVAICSQSCTSTSGTDIFLNGAVFNKNYVSVQLKNYIQNTSNTPFSINSCVFTCRDFSLQVGATNWPLAYNFAPELMATSGPTNILSSPYLLNNYTPANLKAPHATIPSSVGVLVNNSGVSLNPTSSNPIYYSVKIGGGGAGSANLFDNLMYGIYAQNSNVISDGNIFQKTRRLSVGFPYHPRPRPVGGIGIYGWTDDFFPGNSTNYISTVSTVSPSLYYNQFFDCHYGIYLNNTFAFNCQYADFRSTQINTTPYSTFNHGLYGIFVEGNRLKDYNIRYSNFRNVDQGVAILNGVTLLPFLAGSPVGTYFGKVYIQDNYFGPAMSATNIVGTGYMNWAVAAESFLRNPYYSLYYESGSQMKIQNNNINRVYRGVKMNSFSNNSFTTTVNNNTITLLADVNTTNVQRGIEFTNNTAGVVNTNTITGYNITNSLVTGVYFAANVNSSSQCNITYTLNEGFNHAGANLGTQWRYNKMQTNAKGMSLTNGGIIGPQGSYNSPSDNKWLGTWTGTNFSTWTFSSTAYNPGLPGGVTSPSNSVLWVRTTSTYTPPNNSGQPASTSYITLNAIQTANNSAATFDCATGQSGGGGGGNPPGGSSPQMALMESIVTEEMEYVAAEEQSAEINKNHVFLAIENDPTLKSNSTILNDFYNSELSKTRGKLRQIEHDISTGSYGAAGSQLSSLTVENNIQDNYKKFYSILTSYQETNNLSKSDSLMLDDLIRKCPFVEGSIVYQARALYNKAFHVCRMFNDNNCLEDGFSVGRFTSLKKTSVGSNQIFEVFPNPTNGAFYIKSNKSFEKVKVSVSDLLGKVVMTHLLTSPDLINGYDLHLTAGVYMISIEKNNLKSTFKLVITN